MYIIVFHIQILKYISSYLNIYLQNSKFIFYSIHLAEYTYVKFYHRNYNTKVYEYNTIIKIHIIFNSFYIIFYKIM